MNKPILTLAGVILLIAGIIFFMKYCNREKCSEPAFIIEPEGTASTRQQVTFTSIGADENAQPHWIFSDGKEMDGPSVTRYFQTEGSYMAELLVNGNCSKIDSIKITEAAPNPVVLTATYSIVCPDLLMTGVTYQFKVVGEGGKSFQWDFGESGNYESKSAVPSTSYKYNTASTYQIALHVDDKIVATKTVTVKNKPTTGGGGGSGGKKKPCPDGTEIMRLINEFGYAAKNNDEELQAAKRKDLMIRLLGNERVPVEREGAGEQSFETYLNGLMMRFKEVKAVTLECDNDGSISKIIISN